MVSEATHRGRKPGKHAHSQSIARKDSILTNPTLPQELIAAILVRLPVKYLLPFKCVSKDWLYGFGYDEVHDDYKVVVISMKTTREGHAYIFSLKSDSWRRVEDFHSGGSVLGSLATLVNEKLHWVNGEGVKSFDLVDEKWEKVDQPCCRAGGLNLTLGSLGGDFCVLYNYRGTHHDIWADLWVMKKYGVKESWTKLCTIKYPDNSPNYMRFVPLCMSNEGELLLRFNFNSTLAVYNPNDDSKRYRRVANVDGIIAVLLYMESLVCPILQNELRSEQDFVKQEGQA